MRAVGGQLQNTICEDSHGEIGGCLLNLLFDENGCNEFDTELS